MPDSHQRNAKKSPPSLAKLVGAIPVAPRPAKPPMLRLPKPLKIAPPRQSPAKPKPPHAAKPASSTAARPSVAGRLGAFVPKRAKPSP